ncbi:MAG: polymerase sigma-70 factor [Bacteroidota bacterium]|nr:polymerase sigma-70 factor [Bacteroidota bacterium]
MEQHKKYDEALLYTELKSKSRKAFEYLYDNYSAALYGVIVNVLRNEEASNDALQEVFVKIWNNFDSYDPSKSRLYTWMLNIARNHSIDKLRSKNTADRKELKNDKEYVQSQKGAETFVEGIGLRKLVDHLDEDQKQVIDLLYFQGFTQSEAAEELNIPLGTVKSRVRIAIHKLRKFF